MAERCKVCGRLGNPTETLWTGALIQQPDPLDGGICKSCEQRRDSKRMADQLLIDQFIDKHCLRTRPEMIDELEQRDLHGRVPSTLTKELDQLACQVIWLADGMEPWRRRACMRNTLREVVKPRRSIRKRKQTQAAEMSLSAKEQRAKMVRDFVKRNKLCNKTESQWSQQEIHKLARQLHSSQSKNERWNRTMAALRKATNGAAGQAKRTTAAKKRKTRDFTSSVRATRTPTQVRSCLEFDLVLRAVVQWSPGRIRRDVTGIIPLGSVAASHSKACSQTWPLFLHRRPITTSGSRCPFLRRPGFLRGPWRTGRGTASGGLPRRIGTPAARTMPTSSSRPGHPPQQKGAV